jgi:hypothetical protein
MPPEDFTGGDDVSKRAPRGDVHDGEAYED